MSRKKIRTLVDCISFEHQVIRDGIVEDEPDSLIEIKTKIKGIPYFENDDDIDTTEIGEAKAYIYDFDRFYYRDGIRPGIVVSGYLSDIKINFGRFLIDRETGFYNKRLLKAINKKFGIGIYEDDYETALFSFRRIILVYTRQTYPDYRGNGLTYSPG